MGAILITTSLVLGTFSSVLAEIEPRYANTGYAYGCIGNGESDNNPSINTLVECGTVVDYINSWGLYGELKINPTLSEFTDGRLDSPIIYFAGHGQYNHVNTGSSSGISDGAKPGYKDIRNVKLTETKLAVLSACYTASIPGNITERLNLNGADFTLGWKAEIDNEHARRFSAAFCKYLGEQYNYINSISYAINDLLNGADGESPMYNNATIFQYQCYGDKYATIYSDVVKSVKDRYEPLYNDNLKQYKINDDIFYSYKSNDFSELVNYFKENIDENFKIEDYYCLEFDSLDENDFNILSIRYKVGNIVSDFGYNVVMDKSKAIVITEIGNNISEGNIALPLQNVSEDDICKESINSFAISSPIYSQRIEKIFDSFEKKIKYNVITVYGDEDNGFFAKSYESFN